MNKLLDAVSATSAATSIATVNVQAIVSIIAGIVAIISGVVSIIIKLVIFYKNDDKLDQDELKEIVQDLEELKKDMDNKRQ